jgi:hypothetical protein
MVISLMILYALIKSPIFWIFLGIYVLEKVTEDK